MRYLHALAVAVLGGADVPDPDSLLTRVPFDNEAGLIFVEVHIENDGRVEEDGPYTFLVDSGATGAVIERALAERLEIPMGPEVGRDPASPRAEVTYRFAPRVDFRIGEYEFAVRNAVAAPVQELARMMMGREVYGILGHGFLEQCTLEVDHERRELEIHDPERYAYAREGAALPVVFRADQAGLPFTEVRIETASGERHGVDMLIDSGGSILATMGLNDPAMIEVVVPEGAPRIAVQGATGLANDATATMHELFATRVHRVHFGPYAIDRPTTSCKPHNYTGLDLFGAEVLRRFHVVFDYERERILLEPNTAFPAPTRADRGGMFLIASQTDASVRQVRFVTPGGPAEEAGIEAGDVLRSIDGEPADAQSLHATRLLFFERGSFELVFERDGEEHAVTLVTRDLL